jgi:hypothetical protein
MGWGKQGTYKGYTSIWGFIISIISPARLDNRPEGGGGCTRVHGRRPPYLLDFSQRFAAYGTRPLYLSRCYVRSYVD